MSNNYLGPINYQQNGPNKEVFLILGVTKNRDSLYPNGRERGVLLYFRGNGYATTIWAVIKYYTDYSTHKFYFTAVRIDDAESLTILEAKDIPYLEELTTSSITEDMYTTYTYAKSTDIPTKTSQLENDSGYTKQEDLNNYLPLSGGTITGQLDVKNNLSVEGTLELAGVLNGVEYIEMLSDNSNMPNPPTNEDIDATYYSKGIYLINADTGENFELYYPQQTGTFIVKNEDSQTVDLGGVQIVRSAGIVDGIDPYRSPALLFSYIEGETLITTHTNNDQYGALSLGTPNMLESYEVFHNLKFPDTGERTGNDTGNHYDWTLPSKSGTIALLEDLQGGGGGGSGASIELVATGTIVKDSSISIEISNISLKEKTQYVLRLWDKLNDWWNTLTFVYIDGEEQQIVTITNADDDNQIVSLVFNANTAIILGGSSSDTFIYDNGSNYELYEVQGGGSGGVSEEDVLQIIEDNSSNTSQMDVDTSISIGTSTNYNPNSDNQIPTTKAVQEMINVGGGSGSGDYLPLSGGTMTGNIEMPEYKGIVDSSEHSGFIFYGNYPAIANVDNPFVLCMTDDTASGSEAYYYTFPKYDGEVVVKNSDGDIILNNEEGDDAYLIISADDTGFGDYPYIKMYHYGDSIYYGVYFITKEINNKQYSYIFPEKSGTIALTKDIVTESRVNELIAAYMTANYDNGDEGSY